jgi:hypothetical protein
VKPRIRDRQETISLIERTKHEAELRDLMQPVDETGSFNFRWTFRQDGRIGFRQPPGSVSANQCLSWAELARTFVQEAIKNGSSDMLKQYQGNVDALRSFIYRGAAQHFRVNTSVCLDEIFDRQRRDTSDEDIAFLKQHAKSRD